MTSLKREGAWAVVDQVLSSGTNFVPALILARLLGPSSYGTFSIAFLAWFGVLSVLRSALMQTFTIDASPTTGHTWRGITRRASGAVVLGGTVSGVAFAGVAAALGVSTELGQAFLVIAVLAPGMALQEFWRLASFSANRARTAAANDLCWAITQVFAFAVLLTRTQVTVTGGLIAWGAGALVAAGLGIFQLSVVPRPDLAAVRWARKWARLGALFTVETATFSVGAFVIAIIIAARLGNDALGLFRAVQNLFGPIQLLTIGGASIYLPYLVRVIRKPRASGLGEAWRFSALMAGAVLVYGLVLFAAASTVLTKVFGADFAPAAALVFPSVVAFVIDAAGIGAQLLLMAREMGTRLLLATLPATLVRVGAVALLATTGGLRGAVWGWAIGSALSTSLLWAQVAWSRPRRDRTSRRAGEAGGPIVAHALVASEVVEVEPQPGLGGLAGEPESFSWRVQPDDGAG